MTNASEVITPEIISNSNLPSISQIEQEYKAKIESIKKNKSWMRWLVVGGIGIGALVFSSLVANHIINGIIALGSLILFGLAGFYGFKIIKTYDPVVQKKLQTTAMRKLIEEAQQKKIETLTLYVNYLDKYLSYTKQLRNKVDALIEKYRAKYQNTTDETLKKEYLNLINKLSETQAAINKIVENSKKKKDEFEKKLKIAREKYDFVKETKDILQFLQNSNELDKLLVDESLNQLEKEFNEITVSIHNLAKDIE